MRRVRSLVSVRRIEVTHLIEPSNITEPELLQQSRELANRISACADITERESAASYQALEEKAGEFVEGVKCLIRKRMGSKEIELPPAE